MPAIASTDWRGINASQDCDDAVEKGHIARADFKARCI